MVVVYPGIELYLKKYSTSIHKQTFQKFDILLINDNADLGVSEFRNTTIILNVRSGLTHAEIRFEGIKFAIENKYSYLIFTDGDDYYSKNRIELSNLLLHNYDFVYNKIIPVDAAGNLKLIDKNKNEIYPDKISNFEVILSHNLFGMSNTGVSVDKINEMYIPRDIIAVDWWIWTILLLNEAKGKYIKQANTYYRQYDKNTVGTKRKLDRERLRKGLRVKYAHYKNIYKYCLESKLESQASKYFKKLNEIDEIQSKIYNNKFVDNYIKKVNNNLDQIYLSWWSEIISIQQLNKYEN